MKQRLLLILAGWLTVLAVSASNTITISSTEGAPGSEVTVTIGLTNTDAVSSLQVNIPLDESLTLVAGSGQLSSRCGSHTLTVGVKDGLLKVFVFSWSMADISGTNGIVASFRLRLGNQPATVALTPSETLLTNSAGQPLESSVQGAEVTTRCAKAQYSTMEIDFGAVPIRDTYTRTLRVSNVGNADLTVTSLMFSDVNVFSTTTTMPFTVTPGSSRNVDITYQPVERGSISKTLKVGCNSVSKLNTIKLLAQPYAVNELHIQNASGMADEEVTVSMTMNNMDAVSGYQVEFDLPEQFEYVNNSFTLGSRKQDHVGIATLTGNTLRIIAYSGTDKPFTGNDGDIGSFRVKLVGRNGTSLTPTKTVLSATINNKVENVVSAVYDGLIIIQSPQLSCYDRLDFGAVSVTEECEQSFFIYNFGSAPLTISRIVFDNDNMSIKEKLPLVIASKNSQAVTVVYSSLEQTTFGGTMNIYSNDPDQRMKAVTVSGSRFAPNSLSIHTPTVASNGNLKVVVSTDNYDPITGIQFDMEYPSQYFKSFDDNVELMERAAGMTISSYEIDSRTLRFFCYFLTGNSIPTGSGKVMTIQLEQMTGGAPLGDYDITIKNIKLATSELNDKYVGASTISSTFTVSAVLPGDVNGDGYVTITDAVAIVNYLNGSEPAGFNKKAADFDGSGEVTIADAVKVVNMILNK